MYTYGLIDYVASYQLTECDEVIMNDHRGYVVDLEIKRYCKCKLNKYDKLNHTILNNTRKSHILKFNEKVNEVMASFKLKQWVIELQHVSSREVFNVIDDLFLKVLMNASSAVE